MRIAIVAAVIFAAGLWPGLTKSEGPLPDAPRTQKSAATTAPAHPVLVKLAGVLKIWF
jgi:hypothetical protein